MSEKVYCCECEWLDQTSSKQHIRYWLCRAVPVFVEPNYLSHNLLMHEPFARCSYTNPTGECRLYEKRRQPDSDNNTKEPTSGRD